MNRSDRRRALAHCRLDPFGRARAQITDGEEPWMIGFERQRESPKRPPALIEAAEVSERSVSTKPRSSRAAQLDNQPEDGSAPMNENKPAPSTMLSPSGSFRRNARRVSSPSRPPTVVRVRRVIRGSASTRSDR
jgi:hypothetical protein